MSKTIELIYSDQTSDFVPGRAYSNPRFFTSARSGVSKVFLVGQWPNIESAYLARDVPVEHLDIAPRAEPLIAVPPPKTDVDAGNVAIPDDWAGLAWPKLRALASSVSAAPIINSAGARAAIEAELARRVVDILDPLDRPIDEVGGLTLRQLHADIAGLGLDVDPTMSPADLLALRDLHREERDKQGVE
jgi:hypothetical protein